VSVAHNCGSRLWSKGFGQRGNEDASDGNRAFAYQAGGAAVGGDGRGRAGFAVGASLGASLTEEELAGAVSEASANGLFATLYSSLEKGRGFAKPNGFEVIAEFYDAAVSGADPVTARKGFMAMLEHIASNRAWTIIVESPDRFARDLAVQLAGHDMLKAQGITLIPASAPDFFTEETPTAVMVRQILGAVTQFEKASLVAKLKGARDRKRQRAGKCKGRRSHAEVNPALVADVRKLRRANPKTGKRLSLRSIADALAAHGFVNNAGKPFASESIRSVLERCQPECPGSTGLRASVI
jgi:DNA invertase Pin-like site-specific DNA recombinase